MPGLHGQARVGRARALAAQQQPDAAAADLDWALEWAAAQRDALLLDEFRCAALRSLEGAALLRLRIAIATGESDELLFQRIERLRGQALRVSGDAPIVQGHFRERGQLLAAQQRAQAALRGGDSAQWREAQATQHRLEAEWLEHWRRDALIDAPGSNRGLQPVSGFLLDAALQPEEAWVHWLDDGSGSLLALVRWQGRWQRLRLDAAPVARALADVQFQFEALRAGRCHWQAHAQELQRRARLRLQALHKVLWAPLEPLLTGCRQVVLLPDGVLHRVPWAALHDGDAALCERLLIRLATSAARWVQAVHAPAMVSGDVLAVGFGGEGLSGVDAELDALQAALQDEGKTARCLHGGAATRAALLEGASTARLLHLAGHAAVRDDNPAFSALHLADGPLLAHELAGLRLRPGSVAILSACDAARGLRAAANEHLGLLRALWLAGARAAVAAPWALDDEATAAWMARFYRLWAQGQGLAACVQQTQQQSARAGEHPALWGGFAVHGPG
jgi:CHAT domain-containing protein